MINAVFFLKNGAFCGFELSGHEEYEGEFGLVCAAVSSSTELVCNAVLEKFDKNAEAEVFENKVRLMLKSESEAAKLLISAFYEHLEALSEEYGEVEARIVPL